MSNVTSTEIWTFLIGVAVIACIPAVIGQRKGYPLWLGFVLSFIITPILAIIAAVVAPKKN